MRRVVLALLIVGVAMTAGRESVGVVVAQEVGLTNVAPEPPPGGLTQVVAGTTDVQALIDAQTFDVASVWRFDVGTQEFQVYVPGGPAFVNSLLTLDVTDVVTLKRVPTLTLTLRVSFNGVDNAPGRSPDATIAAGPVSLVFARNSTIVIKTKTGGLVDSKTMVEFFALVTPQDGQRLTDPYAIFDPDSDRFFVVASDRIFDFDCVPGTCVAVILLAVSKTSEPQGLGSADWYFYSLDRNVNLTQQGTVVTALQGDFDHLGVTRDLLVIGIQIVNFEETQGFGQIRVVDKWALVSGAPVTTWTDFRELPERPIPAVPGTDGGASDTVFVFFRVDCVAGAGASESLLVGAISGPPSNPVLTMREVPSGLPCQGPTPTLVGQPQGGRPLDVALLNVAPAYHDGSLWIVRHSGPGPENVLAIRWTELDVTGWPDDVRVVQAGLIGGDETSSFAPALIVDASGNLAMVFGRAGPAEFASAVYTGRSASDPLGTLTQGVVLKAGVSTYEHNPSGRNRYTDYFGAALDPIDGSIWLMGMFASGPTTSGTWIGNVAFDP